MNTQVSNAASFAMGSLADLGQLKKAVKKTQQDLPTGGGGSSFLRMEKTGNWVYGTANTVVEPGSIWAVNPASYHHGFVCWTDFPKEARRKNEVLGRVLVPLGAEKPAKENLSQYVDRDGYSNNQPWPWTDCATVELLCLSGEDKGMKLVYETNSKGGLGLLNRWYDKMSASLDVPEDEVPTPVALVRLVNDSYDHNVYGKIVTPDFEYVEWRALDDATEVDDEGEPEPPAATVRGSGRAAPQQAAAQRSGGARSGASRPAAQPAAQEPEPDAQVDEGDAPAPTRRRRPV